MVDKFIDLKKFTNKINKIFNEIELIGILYQYLFDNFKLVENGKKDLYPYNLNGDSTFMSRAFYYNLYINGKKLLNDKLKIIDNVLEYKLPFLVQLKNDTDNSKFIVICESGSWYGSPKTILTNTYHHDPKCRINKHLLLKEDLYVAYEIPNNYSSLINIYNF